MKNLVLLILLIFFLGKATAQNISGKVFNSKSRLPVENVVVQMDGEEEIFYSDAEGFFRISAEDFPVILEFSALGFRSKIITVENPGTVGTVFLVPSSEELSEVIIRSTLLPRKLLEIPAAISVISSEELQRSDPTNLVEAINHVPGVYVNQGALNTNKINIRGIGARSQYSTNRIQSYFNGIPLTTAEGDLTLDDIDPDVLTRIEIIKGPTSSLYGAGLGGVINLYAAEADPGKSEVAVENIFGSFGMSKNSVSASHGGEGISIFANFTNLETNGYRENGNYSRNSGLVHGMIQSSNNNKLSFLANFTRLKAYIPSSINEEDYLNDPSTAAFTWAQSRGYESYDRGLLGISYESNLSGSLSNTTSSFLNFRDAYEPRPFDILKEERISAGGRTKFNFSTEIFELRSNLSFGAEYYKEWYETGTFENLYQEFPGTGSVRGERLSNNEQDRNYANFFTQLNLEFAENFIFEAGLNFNITNYSLTDLFVEDEVDQSGDYSFEKIFSPRIGIVYNLTENKNIYASISHGFSTPTVAETLTPEGLINTSLKPETGFNYETGFKGNWLKNALYTEVSLYSIRINDLLVAQRIAEDRYVGINAGKTTHNGIELFAAYTTNPLSIVVLKPHINAAFNFFKFKEFEEREVDYSGNKLPGVPVSTINLGLEVDLWEDWELYVNYFSVGKIPLNDANSDFTEGYDLFNLNSSYTLAFTGDLKLRFSAGINNITDEKYASSVLPNAVGFGGAAPRYYYPGNPRNYYAGVQLKYQF